MKRNFANKAFILGDEISETLSAEHFRKSGDMLLFENGAIALSLYRQSIELQLKSFLKRLRVEYDFNYNLEELLSVSNDTIDNLKILNSEEVKFFNEIISDYITLDKKGSSLRYPNDNYVENLILSDKFIKKTIVNDVDNPYFYEIKERETKENIDKLFMIFFNIQGWIEEKERCK